jgi:hypothetical protein
MYFCLFRMGLLELTVFALGQKRLARIGIELNRWRGVTNLVVAWRLAHRAGAAAGARLLEA